MNILKREGFENHENDHQQLIVFILLQTLLTNSLRKYNYGDDLGEFENLNFEFLRVKSQRAWGAGGWGYTSI